MKVGVIGTSYVGLVVGACLAEAGNDVICVDTDASRVGRLHRGHLPDYEAALDYLVGRNLETGRISFTADMSRAVRASYVIFLASEPVWTRAAGAPDRRRLRRIGQQIGLAMNAPKVVALRSSVVAAATLWGVQHAITSETAFDVHVCSNPGVLERGRGVPGFMRPDRIVIGTDSPRAEGALRELYSPFSKDGHAIVIMDPASAEITAGSAYETWIRNNTSPRRRTWEW